MDMAGDVAATKPSCKRTILRITRIASTPEMSITTWLSRPALVAAMKSDVVVAPSSRPEYTRSAIVPSRYDAHQEPTSAVPDSEIWSRSLCASLRWESSLVIWYGRTRVTTGMHSYSKAHPRAL